MVRRRVRTGTIPIIPMPARRMAFTVRNGSLAECLSVSAPGITGAGVMVDIGVVRDIGAAVDGVALAMHAATLAVTDGAMLAGPTDAVMQVTTAMVGYARGYAGGGGYHGGGVGPWRRWLSRGRIPWRRRFPRRGRSRRRTPVTNSGSAQEHDLGWQLLAASLFCLYQRSPPPGCAAVILMTFEWPVLALFAVPLETGRNWEPRRCAQAAASQRRGPKRATAEHRRQAAARLLSPPGASGEPIPGRSAEDRRIR